MRKAKTKIIPAEIAPLSRSEQAAEVKRMIAEAVNEQVQAALSGPDAVFQPWFNSRSVRDEIKKRQTVAEQRKFALYFEEYGCMVCHTQTVGHHSLGMCHKCNEQIASRLRRIVQKNSASDPNQPTFMETATVARQALREPVAMPRPDSAYRTQGEAAQEVGISPAQLSVWLRAGIVPYPVTRVGATRRLWTEEEVERLRKFVATQRMDGRTK